MKISSNFDSGNIELIDSNEEQINLAIRRDTHSDFFQWFHFRLQGNINDTYRLCIVNAGESAYVEGWKDYQVVASYDRENWFRVPTQFDGKVLSFEHQLTYNSIYFAYFAPYSQERHLDLLQQASQSDFVQLMCVGETIEQRPMDVIKVGPKDDGIPVWVIARQHPGETMAEWFIEGLLSRLLDEEDPVASALREQLTFYIVPNMNPDGSFLGNLRTNAAGINLNREWASPDAEKSPEVYCIKDMMEQTGCRLFLDIHGDEAIPYNFIAASEGIPSYTEKMAHQESLFSQYLLEVSPDFQVQYGYPKDAPGQANLTVASSAVAEQFGCLSLTVEMPFKDNNDLPNAAVGWSPNRSITFGRDMLGAILRIVPELKE